MDFLLALSPSLLWGSMGIVLMKMGGTSRQQATGQLLGGGVVAMVIAAIVGVDTAPTMMLIAAALGVAQALGVQFQLKAFHDLGVSRTMPITTGAQLIGISLLGILLFGEWLGPVDVESGVMIHPTHLPKWHGFPLADRLRQETGLKVVVEKDVVAAAIAHRWSMENSTESAVIVYVGTGIGAGVVSEGRVVRGATGNSGSVAHIVIETSAEAELCRCGRRGCVTATASPTALVRRAKEAGLQLPGPTNREALTELFDMARAGDPVAKRLVDSAVSGLTTMVLALTDLLEPDRLVLGGPFWAVYRSGLLDGLRQLLNDPPEDSPLDGIEVSESALGDELGAIGAGLLVLDRQLTP